MRRPQLVFTLALTACASDQALVGRQDPAIVPNPRAIVPSTQVDRMVQVTPPQVDILWVIDNSCSMSCVVGCHGSVSDVVAENFPAFMQHFLGSGIDYHIGVVTTDMADPAHHGKLQPALGQEWIDPGTPKPIETFFEMATQGTTGSGVEKGLQAGYVALEELGDTENAGFFRPEAALHTIVLTDEDDQSNPDVITLDEFVAWYDAVNPTQDHSFNGILCTRNISLPCPYGPNTTYLDAIAEIGGLTIDIEDDDWVGAMSALGERMSGAQEEWYLSRIPVPRTIEVAVRLEDGVEISFTDEEWNYIRVRNSIRFVDYIPPADAEVLITYEVDGSA